MRINQIVTTDLAKDKLLLETRLEDTINSNLDVAEKLIIIKDTLKEIALVESMFVKWANYMSELTNNEEGNE